MVGSDRFDIVVSLALVKEEAKVPVWVVEGWIGMNHWDPFVVENLTAIQESSLYALVRDHHGDNGAVEG